MSNAAFPVSELSVVIRESISDGLALALRDGISGKLFSHLLDPQGSGREAFHAAVFKWAASDLPQRLDEKRIFNTFALLFLDGLKTLRRFFPDATPVRQTLADAEAFKDYILLSTNSMTKHRAALADYDKRLQADYAAMREWFSCHSLVGEAIRHIGNLCKRLVEKGKTRSNRRPTTSLGKGPQTAFMRDQRRAFAKFLERRPITPSVSAITRAHQCWNEHKTEWNEAAAKGDGYSSHKTLACAV